MLIEHFVNFFLNENTIYFIFVKFHFETEIDENEIISYYVMALHLTQHYSIYTQKKNTKQNRSEQLILFYFILIITYSYSMSSEN